MTALTAELAAARREIEDLQRKLRGEPPVAHPSEAAKTAAVQKELEAARLLLSGLMDGQIIGARALAKRPNPVLKALREALRTTLYRKFGGIDIRARKAIVANHHADTLIEQIVTVAMASVEDKEKIMRMFG